ncbi:protein kinase [Kitasatospora sp. NPDC050543]|uniref:protein kinase domain-containing protein n=1 Tax=Kitasatospora sp. NPDC050543 TaxID=3364054 RepID=UPI0037A2EAA9
MHEPLRSPGRGERGERCQVIGRALNGRYELVETIGVGGMATVWRGVDRVLGRPVAVKVLNGGLADDPRFAERFSREAQHAAMLAHPRIVMVFDSGVDQGSPYIVMELVQGRPLSALLAEWRELPVERAVGIGAAVCEALEVAHGAGLVHRDIKPGNIMITDDGGVKVVDFGIARVNASGSRLTQTASVVGTAAYLSPEQATAAAVDARADLYAVGCVLVEMLTGEPPFLAEAPVAIAFKHVSEQPEPPSARRHGIPPALDAAVLRLLAKDPSDRPADAAAARAELLATVPSPAVTDRTAELLGAAPAGPGQPTQAPPPFADHLFADGSAARRPLADQQRTTVLPAQRVAPATSLMPAVPAGYEAESGLTGPPPAPAGRSRRPLLLGALGLAGVVGAAAVAFVVLNGPGAPGAAAPQASSSSFPSSPAVTGTPESPAPSPSTVTPSPSAPSSAQAPTPTSAGPAVAAAIQAFRQTVARTQLTKERDRQGDLVKILDDAARRVQSGQADDAEQELKTAQRVVRDLAKKRAIDDGTLRDWDGRLKLLVAAAHTVAAGDGN